MTALRWEHRPELDRPVLVAAFAGWNDAGEAATGAVKHLAEQWRARSFASIDPEDFFDFTETRPLVKLRDGVTRTIEWPSNRFTWAKAAAGGPDVVFLHGTEPQLKWRTFSDSVIECAREINASMVITLGGLLADVPHTRPSHVSGTTADPALLDRLGLQPSQYEGPTGIVGVLHYACSRAGIPSASFWVSVPHYVGHAASPKAALALVERTCSLLGVTVETTDLEIASVAHEQQVTEVVEEDEDMVFYVLQLEESDDAERGQAERIAAEAERFLRGHGE